MQTIFRRPFRFLIPLLALSLILAGCSSSGGRKASDKQTSEKKLKVALITHAVAGDTFWDIVRKGAEKAAKRDNIDLKYSHSKEGSKQEQLVKQAVDKKVDGIVLTLAKPDAMAPAVKEAQKANIPVISINAGEKASKKLGLLTHFGQNDEIAGEEAGKKLNKLGAKHTVCVIHEQGHVGLEHRCSGVDDAFDGKYDRLYVKGEDASDVKSTIKSKIQQDSSIDYVLTVGAPYAEMAKKPVKEAGSHVNLATFDLNGDVAEDVESGAIKFTVDQQPYLQGYEGVDGIRLYKDNLNVLGGGSPVSTGPQIVTKKNAKQIGKYAKRGTR